MRGLHCVLQAWSRLTGVSIGLLGLAGIVSDIPLYWVVLVLFLQRGPITPQSEEISVPGGSSIALGVGVLLLGLLLYFPFPFVFSEVLAPLAWYRPVWYLEVTTVGMPIFLGRAHLLSPWLEFLLVRIITNVRISWYCRSFWDNFGKRPSNRTIRWARTRNNSIARAEFVPRDWRLYTLCSAWGSPKRND